jgi:hypothetical protein
VSIFVSCDNSSDPEALHFGVFERLEEPVNLQSSTKLLGWGK